MGLPRGRSLGRSVLCCRLGAGATGTGPGGDRAAPPGLDGPVGHRHRKRAAVLSGAPGRDIRVHRTVSSRTRGARSSADARGHHQRPLVRARALQKIQQCAQLRHVGETGSGDAIRSKIAVLKRPSRGLSRARYVEATLSSTPTICSQGGSAYGFLSRRMPILRMTPMDAAFS